MTERQQRLFDPILHLEGLDSALTFYKACVAVNKEMK